MNRVNKIKQNLIFFGLIAICFDAYSIVYIGDFPVTISVLCVAAILFLGIVDSFFNKTINIEQFIPSALIIILAIISSLLSGSSMKLTSTLLYCFYFIAFIVSRHTITKDCFLRKIHLVLNIYTIFCIFGIYQFFAYIFELPFSDLTIPGHMVSGFNTTNLVYIADFSFYRAHSIYLEPSTLSQFSALSIGLAYILYKNNIISFRNTVFLFLVNIIAIIMSVAGTGILVLVVFFVYWIIKNIFKTNNHKFKRNLLISLVLGIILFICLFDTVIVQYIINRILEFADPKFSGGMRFSYPYYIMFYSFTQKILGFGCGNEFIASAEYFKHIGVNELYPTLASGYAKIGVEIGIIGLFLFIVLLFSLRKKDKNIKEINYIYLFVLMLNFIGGNLLQSYFWVFMFFLNFSFKEKDDLKVQSSKGETK